MPEEQQQMTPEQVEELKEKVKNMSPEELKEFQKKQCIFCHIVAGKVQSKKIYEDDKSLAILDINPANPGHILLLPKEHYSIMPQIPEDILQHLFMTAKALSNAALRSLGIQGTNIIVANGVAAGQKANHFMIHIIPRKENDGVNFELPQKKIEEKELVSIRKKLAEKIASLTGKKQAVKGPSIASPKPAIEPKEKVVEAEFKEPVKEILKPKPVKKKKVVKKAKPKKKAEKKKIKTKKKTKTAETNVSLDDISNLLK